MKHVLLCAFLFAVLTMTVQGAAVESPTVSQNVISYGVNLFKYAAWILTDTFCLSIGWVGILLLNDAASVYSSCQMTFVDWWVMMQ